MEDVQKFVRDNVLRKEVRYGLSKNKKWSRRWERFFMWDSCKRLCFSKSIVFNPHLLAKVAAERPPFPPPITITSYFSILN